MPERQVAILKLRLTRALNHYQTENKLTQGEMAILLETSQPRVSNLRNEQTSKFTLDQLFKWVYTLDIKATLSI